LSWQPFFALFASYQTIFVGDVPGPGLILQAALWAVAFLVIGTRVFLRRERELAMRL
jgi:ABC-type polysaccharide/polyol phosphate export permease